jgi:hypothetical protein
MGPSNSNSNSFPPKPLFGPQPEPASTISLSPTQPSEAHAQAPAQPSAIFPLSPFPFPRCEPNMHGPHGPGHHSPVRRSPPRSALHLPPERLTSGPRRSVFPLPPFSSHDPKLPLPSARCSAPPRSTLLRPLLCSTPQCPAPTTSPLARSATGSPTAAPLLSSSPRSFFPFLPHRDPAPSRHPPAPRAAPLRDNAA